MTSPLLEDCLRDHYSQYADRLTLSEISFDDLVLPSPAHQTSPMKRRVVLAIAAAVLLVTGVGTALLIRSGPTAQPPATTGSPVSIETTISTTAVTTSDAGSDDILRAHRPETVPYDLDIAGVAPQQDGVSYTDPAAGGVGRTFVSADGSLSKVLIMVGVPVESAQFPPTYTGSSITVPMGDARFDATPYAGVTRFQWDLPGRRLMIHAVGMKGDDAVVAAIDYQQTGRIDGLELDAVWGADRAATVRDYRPLTNGGMSVASAPDQANVVAPTFTAQLELSWAAFVGWPGAPAPQYTEVLGRPAWRWTTGDDSTSATFVAWQIPESRRWMQLTAPTSTIEAVLAALVPTDVTTPTTSIGYLAVPSMDGGAFVLDGIVGQRLDQLTSGNAVHDASTALPEDSAHAPSLIYVSREQFGALETLAAGVEVSWEGAGSAESISFEVTSVHSYDVNTDPLAAATSGLVIVTDIGRTDSDRQIVITAHRVEDQPGATSVSS